MSAAECRGFDRLIVEATCNVQCLVWALRIADGTVSLPFHEGKAKNLQLDVSLAGDEPSGPWECRTLRLAEPAHSRPRVDVAQLEARVKASLQQIAVHSTFRLGPEPFDLGFGRVEFTIRKGKVRDFVVARRLLLDEEGRLRQVPAAGSRPASRRGESAAIGGLSASATGAGKGPLSPEASVTICLRQGTP